MLFFGIVFVIVFIAGLVINCVDEGFSFGGLLMSICGGLLFSLLVAFVSMIISVFVVCSEVPEIVPAEQTRIDLLALKDHNSSYYLRRGYVKDSLKYVYLYEEEGKGIATDTVSANLSYINYIKDGEQPYLIKTYYRFKNPLLHFFLTDVIINTEYSIFVPEGSIVAEGTYEIDLE